MITVAGKQIQNSPKDKNDFENLLMGELNSKKMQFLKTPLHVYGTTIEELEMYALYITNVDPEYDTMFVYDVENDGIRDFLQQTEI